MTDILVTLTNQEAQDLANAAYSAIQEERTRQLIEAQRALKADIEDWSEKPWYRRLTLPFPEAQRDPWATFFKDAILTGSEVSHAINSIREARDQGPLTLPFNTVKLLRGWAQKD